MAQTLRRWRLPSVEDTMAMAARFALAWRPAPAALQLTRATRVALSGELGAGKTSWVRGFVAARGVMTPVVSPSFALLQTYDAGELRILHADFYRLNDPAEIDALALDDADRPGVLWLIEWPERALNRIGQWDLRLNFEIEPDAHAVTAEAMSQGGVHWLSQVLD